MFICESVKDKKQNEKIFESCCVRVSFIVYVFAVGVSGKQQ